MFEFLSLEIYYPKIFQELIFKCSGHTGHGSVNFKNTAGEKLSHILHKMYEFRKTQVDKMESDPTLEEGDITSVNLTMINGGVLRNVVPATITAMFDIRLVPDFDLRAFEKQVCCASNVSEFKRF